MFLLFGPLTVHGMEDLERGVWPLSEWILAPG